MRDMTRAVACSTSIDGTSQDLKSMGYPISTLPDKCEREITCFLQFIGNLIQLEGDHQGSLCEICLSIEK